MTYGYADNKRDVFNDVDKMYQDEAYYSNKMRPELNKLLENINFGDTLVVKSVSHLSWGVRNVVNLVGKLLDEGVILKILDIERYDLKNIVNDFAKADRRQFAKIKEATLRHAGGPKIKIDKDSWLAYYMLYKNKSIKKLEMAEKLGLSIATFYRRFREYEASLV
jgi:DNA invertase Pin-like site-specific DNA recombinase